MAALTYRPTPGDLSTAEVEGFLVPRKALDPGALAVLLVFVVLASLAISRGVNDAEWSLKPLYNPQEFSLPLIFSALSVAVLSFLGFDAISTLSEETRGGSRVVGRATLLALTLVAALPLRRGKEMAS